MTINTNFSSLLITFHSNTNDSSETNVNCTEMHKLRQEAFKTRQQCRLWNVLNVRETMKQRLYFSMCSQRPTQLWTNTTRNSSNTLNPSTYVDNKQSNNRS